jgi:hypothetical protein
VKCVNYVYYFFLKWNSVFTVGRSKKNEFATNENGIHISPKIESVLEKLTCGITQHKRFYILIPFLEMSVK